MADIKVLFIDDEADLREIMCTRIRMWGYTALAAAGGEAGIRMIENERPDLVILDYMMPGMDGIATLEKIRTIDEKIPVIMFTAHPDNKSLEGTERLNVAAYIPKLSLYTDAHRALKTAIHMAVQGLRKKE